MATATVLQGKARRVTAYLNLAKPWGILPHFVTAAAAMCLAAGGAPPVPALLFTLLGGGCVAAAANTFNSYFDRDIDALMARTRRRPLPSLQLTSRQALACGAGLALAGVIILSGLVNWATAVLSVIALAYYVLPYTLWLKRRTCWSVIIGSGIGAMTPLIGWVAVTNRIAVAPFLLSGIIMLWTLPHFWALAVSRRKDYERAGLTVLPLKGVTAWIIACSLLLVAATLLLVPASGMGRFYIWTAGVLGGGFLYLSLRMNLREPFVRARRLYVFSVFYIALLFGAMIVDKLLF